MVSFSHEIERLSTDNHIDSPYDLPSGKTRKVITQVASESKQMSVKPSHVFLNVGRRHQDVKNQEKGIGFFVKS